MNSKFTQLRFFLALILPIALIANTAVYADTNSVDTSSVNHKFDIVELSPVDEKPIPVQAPEPAENEATANGTTANEPQGNGLLIAAGLSAMTVATTVGVFLFLCLMPSTAPTPTGTVWIRDTNRIGTRSGGGYNNLWLHK